MSTSGYYNCRLQLNMFDLGLSMNPISLDDPEDNSSSLMSKLEEARNKAIIQEAEFTNDPLELCLAVAKTCIEGDLLTKNRVLNKTIIKYFQEKIEMKISHEYFQEKPSADYSDPETVPNLQQLILYGVDFLTTNAIRARLKEVQTQIKEIIWMNDSTCKIVCRSEQQAQRILTNQVCLIKIDEEQGDLRSWRLIKPYTLFSFDRNLWLRYATSKQSTVERKKSSKYDEYSKAKTSLALYMLEKFHALQKYKEVVEEIEEKKRSKHRRANRNESRQRLFSRSREKNSNRDRRHNERAPLQENQRRRENRFSRYNNLSRKPPLNTSIRYQHVPLGKNHHDSSFSQERKRINQDSNISNTDFNVKKEKDKNSSALFDNISEIDSSLSFIFKGKDMNEQDDRMDFQYQLRSQRQHSEISDHLEYQRHTKIQNKTPHNSSFIKEEKTFNNKEKEKHRNINSNQSFCLDVKDRKRQSQPDCFDFRYKKSEAASTKNSKMDSSFSYNKNQKNTDTKVNNHDDDDSY